LVSKEEWRADRRLLYSGVVLFMGWKVGIPVALAVIALHTGIGIGTVWAAFVGVLCWLGTLNARKQGDAEAAVGLFVAGTVMVALSLWNWCEQRVGS
jgi:hypothetical protein